MPNDFYTQYALANDQGFRRRVRGALGIIATTRLTTATTDPKYQARAVYARQVLANLDAAVNGIVGWLVMRPNLLNDGSGKITSFTHDLGIPCAVTTATDQDIQSQLDSDWDFLAGA